MNTIPERLGAFSRTQARRRADQGQMVIIINAVASLCAGGEYVAAKAVDDLTRQVGLDRIEALDATLTDLGSLGLLVCGPEDTFSMDPKLLEELSRLGAPAWLEAAIAAAGKRLAQEATDAVVRARK